MLNSSFKVLSVKLVTCWISVNKLYCLVLWTRSWTWAWFFICIIQQHHVSLHTHTHTHRKLSRSSTSMFIYPPSPKRSSPRSPVRSRVRLAGGERGSNTEGTSCFWMCWRASTCSCPHKVTSTVIGLLLSSLWDYNLKLNNHISYWSQQSWYLSGFWVLWVDWSGISIILVQARLQLLLDELSLLCFS